MVLAAMGKRLPINLAMTTAKNNVAQTVSLIIKSPLSNNTIRRKLITARTEPAIKLTRNSFHSTLGQSRREISPNAMPRMINVEL